MPYVTICRETSQSCDMRSCDASRGGTCSNALRVWEPAGLSRSHRMLLRQGVAFAWDVIEQGRRDRVESRRLVRVA